MRKNFPLLKKIVYLDSGAGTLKPTIVIDEIIKYYNDYPINTHSIDSKLGSIVYKKMNETKEMVASLVNSSNDEVILTSGTTESINKLSYSLDSLLKKGDQILISSHNHSSNAVPWIQLAKRVGAKVVVSDNLLEDINKKTKILAYAQVNNSIEENYCIKELYKKCKENNTILFNDAAQAIVCEKVTLKYSDAIAFSGTKIYGPTGTGALVIKKELMDKIKPVIIGGGAIIKFNNTSWETKEGVYGFESGTPNVSGLIAMGVAIKFMMKNWNPSYKKELVKYAYDNLNKMKNIKIISNREDYNVLFKIDNIESQDVVSYLGHKNIILRAGKQCALYLFDNNEVENPIRMSFADYNTKKDIDIAIDAIKKGGDFLDIF